jgi:D-serine deaminase-like pyridoxal phosphate-dependent protein
MRPQTSGLRPSAFPLRASARHAGLGPSAAAIRAIVQLQSAGSPDHSDDAAGLKLHGDTLREQAETTGSIHEDSPGAAPELLATRFVAHSEEHLVFETPDHSSLRVGDVLYGIPWHVCPTVALHGQAVVIRDGRATERWAVTARVRMLSV